mmetsp:Transcript_6756/g.11926  ORF Transcript_6756/g.11926 Transcript_6756/m.11926 type:complete len:213 (+) Transcript_6756:1184-1822(+)
MILSLQTREMFLFLPTSLSHSTSFNVIAAVSEALAKARQKDPSQVLEELYERVGYKALVGDNSLVVKADRHDPDAPVPHSEMDFNSNGPLTPSKNLNSRANQLASVAAELEAELTDLNGRYQDLLLSNSRAARPKDQHDRTDTVSESDAVEMAHLLDVIQQRSTQLETLKKAMRPRSPKPILFSPEANRKKVAALSLLREFRDSSRRKDGSA